PELFAQTNERLAAKFENRTHGIDHQMIVEQAQAEPHAKLAGDREFAAGDGAMNENELHGNVPGVIFRVRNQWAMRLIYQIISIRIVGLWRAVGESNPFCKFENLES